MEWTWSYWERRVWKVSSKKWSHTDHFLCVFFIYFELDTYQLVFSLLCNPKKSFVSTKSITTHHCVVNVIDVVCLLSNGVQNDKNHKKRKLIDKTSYYYWGFFRIGIGICDVYVNLMWHIFCIDQQTTHKSIFLTF